MIAGSPNVVKAAFVVFAGLAPSVPVQSQDAKQIMQTMVQHEKAESARRGHYAYISEERSDRTGGHLWTEHNAETDWGIVKYLVAEDGKPLPRDRKETECTRLSRAAADPETFKRLQAKEDADAHSQQMLLFLTKGFLFDSPNTSTQEIRIAFRPDPGYSPQTIDERALHAMSGTVVIDANSMRLREISGRVPQDMSLGFGPFATLHAGSEFSTTREHIGGTDWKTGRVHTAIKGKAFFIKTIAQQEDSTHSEFKQIAQGMTVSEAVALVEK